MFILILSGALLRAQPERIMVIVNSDVYTGLQPEITRYMDDIAPEYTVELYETGGGTAQDLKDFIVSRKNNLAGCVFIGAMPVFRFELNTDEAAGYPTTFPCDLYFMDMDGSWSDADHNGIYDTHVYGTGDVGPEIFIGRIDASGFTSTGETQIEILRRYFDRDHAYWSGAYNLRKTGLAYTDDDWENYFPINNEMKYLYGEGNYHLISDDRVGSVDFLSNRLENDQYEFIQLAAHSSESSHGFTMKGTVSSEEILQAAPKALGYNLFACSACDYTKSNFIGGAYIFGRNTKSLVVTGTTKIGSMLQFYAFYGPMGENKCIGKAFREWFDYISPYSNYEKSWHYGMTILGDPLITFNSGTVNHGPIVNVGSNRSLLLTESTCTLNETVHDDGLPEGSILTHQWSKVNGPGDVIFEDPGAFSTTCHFTVPGNYRIKAVADDGEYHSEDYLNVNVSRIQKTGEAPRPPYGVSLGLMVRDTLAYVSSLYDLTLYNIADKSNPHLLSSCPFPGFMPYPALSSLYIDSCFVYVASGHEGLNIFNVSDPLNPYYTGNFSTNDANECMNDVVVSGDYAFVADSAHGLMILDIRDRTSPVLSGFCPTAGTADAVYIQGNYGYIADGPNGMRIIDIKDKKHPVETGFFNDAFDEDAFTDYRQHVEVMGNYAYISYRRADRHLCISIVDISDKTRPTEVSHLYTYYKSFQVEGNYLYYAGICDYDVFGIYDITDKSDPRLIESYTRDDVYFQTIMGMYEYDHHLYLDDQYFGRGLNIFRLALDNTAPQVFAGDDATASGPGYLLQGMASDDNLPAGQDLSCTWEKIGGPGKADFKNSGRTETRVMVSDTGTYTFRLTADDGTIRSSDTVKIRWLIAAPLAENAEICGSSNSPDLFAEGQNVRWYRDPDLTDVAYEGNIFATGQSAEGVHTYYATQTIGGIEGLSRQVTLTIRSVPYRPEAYDQRYCEDGSGHSLYAGGTDLKWYKQDPVSGNPVQVATGNSYRPGLILPGSYAFEITQTLDGCESAPDTLTLLIDPLPPPPLTLDTSVCEGEPVPDMTATGVSVIWYPDINYMNAVFFGNHFPTGKTEPGTYTWYATQLSGNCESRINAATLTILPQPPPPLAGDISGM